MTLSPLWLLASGGLLSACIVIGYVLGMMDEKHDAKLRREFLNQVDACPLHGSSASKVSE